MRIEFTLTDDEGASYHGAAELLHAKIATRRAVSPQVSKALKSLRDHILHLRSQGFFHEPRTANGVHAEVQKTYRCQLDRVQMALLRLLRKRELRKTVKSIGGRDQVAYVW